MIKFSKEDRIYLTSDLHLCHDADFVYGPRGFKNTEEHSIEIVNNINSIVDKDNQLIILGDSVLSDTDRGIEFLKQINCKNIYFVRGNHDSDERVRRYIDECKFNYLGYAQLIQYGKWKFMLSHYSMNTTNMDDVKKTPRNRVWNLCGHTHQKEVWDENGLSYHVELDAHNNRPILLDDIIDTIKARIMTDNILE